MMDVTIYFIGVQGFRQRCEFVVQCIVAPSIAGALLKRQHTWALRAIGDICTKHLLRRQAFWRMNEMCVHALPWMGSVLTDDPVTSYRFVFYSPTKY